jgi:hypothetical protein
MPRYCYSSAILWLVLAIAGVAAATVAAAADVLCHSYHPFKIFGKGVCHSIMIISVYVLVHDDCVNVHLFTVE